MINVFQPILGKEELALVEKVFKSNWIGKGEFVRDFECAFAKHLDVPQKNFLTTTCCTEGLFLASKIFEFSKEDEIIVPSVSFVAAGSCVVESGANLVLCDVDVHTLNATVNHIEKVYTKNTKAIILNHYGGIPCDMDPIVDFCRTKNIILIEDSACAVKSYYKGRACGTFGDMGLWSFDAMKTITVGDGGMVYFASTDLVDTAKEYLYLGLPSREKSGMDSSENGNLNWWEYSIEKPGRRAIMNNISGAIGVAQLEKLDQFIESRKRVYDIYARELRGLEWLTIPEDLPDYVINSYYFFWVQSDYRDELARFLLENGVYTTFRYWPLHNIELFNPNRMEFPASTLASKRTINLPIHPALTDNDIGKVLWLIQEFGKTKI